jgi:hypothetical protein
MRRVFRGGKFPPGLENIMGTDRNDIFLGRQPIVDRRQQLVAYELLYRSGRMATAEVRDNAGATAEVMRQAFRRIGIDTVLGECAGFVNVDAGDALQPPHRGPADGPRRARTARDRRRRRIDRVALP